MPHSGPDTSALKALVGLIFKTFPPENREFLSFSRFSRAYSLQSLDFLNPSGPPFERSQAYGEIAELVNRIPPQAGVYDLGADALHLWDVYAQILACAQTAASSAGDELQTRYVNARDMLFKPPDHDELSDAHVAYLQYRDAYRAAESACSAAGASEGSPLHEAKKQALDDWTILGRRYDVENWRLDIVKYQLADPKMMFERLRSQYDPENAAVWKSFGDLRFLPTLLSPSNLSTAPWLDVTYEKEDLNRLSVAGPSTPTELWGESETASKLKRLRVQLLAVDVVRPWWSDDILTSRLWRMPTGHDPYVEGPPTLQGRLQGIVTGLILARSLGVVYESEPSVPPSLGFIQPVSLAELKVDEVARIRTHLAGALRPIDSTRSSFDRQPVLELLPTGTRIRPSVGRLLSSVPGATVSSSGQTAGMLRWSVDHRALPLLAVEDSRRLQSFVTETSASASHPSVVTGPAEPEAAATGDWQLVIDASVAYIAAMRCRRVSGPVPNPDQGRF